MERDPLSFLGKTVIVTGGNGGIGQGIVETFTRHDANVVVADRSPPLKPLVSKGKGRIVEIATDITDRASVDAMVAATLNEFGRIDVLINNAGRGEGMLHLPDIKPDQLDWMIALNIVGTVNCTQAVTAVMLENGGGSIVNISSNAALSGFAGQHDPIYAGCKGFINSFSKAVAMDMGAKNIRCNIVAPGWIVPESDEATSRGSFWNTMELFGTPQSFNESFERGDPLHNVPNQALKRLGRPRDIAYACLYFASDAAAHTTGQIMSIGGGDYMPS
jgi:NAD(P)-dependent dehydrogenase (short-subunit alcohol dehydrogenase family)